MNRWNPSLRPLILLAALASLALPARADTLDCDYDDTDEGAYPITTEDNEWLFSVGRDPATATATIRASVSDDSVVKIKNGTAWSSQTSVRVYADTEANVNRGYPTVAADFYLKGIKPGRATVTLTLSTDATATKSFLVIVTGDDLSNAISFSPATAEFGEGGNLRLKVRLGTPVAANKTVNLAVSGTGDPAAHVTIPDSVVFPGGTTTPPEASFSVSGIDGDYDFLITATDPAAEFTSGVFTGSVTNKPPKISGGPTPAEAVPLSPALKNKIREFSFNEFSPSDPAAADQPRLTLSWNLNTQVIGPGGVFSNVWQNATDPDDNESYERFSVTVTDGDDTYTGWYKIKVTDTVSLFTDTASPLTALTRQGGIAQDTTFVVIGADGPVDWTQVDGRTYRSFVRPRSEVTLRAVLEPGSYPFGWFSEKDYDAIRSPSLRVPNSAINATVRVDEDPIVVQYLASWPYYHTDPSMDPLRGAANGLNNVWTDPFGDFDADGLSDTWEDYYFQVNMDTAVAGPGDVTQYPVGMAGGGYGAGDNPDLDADGSPAPDWLPTLVEELAPDGNTKGGWPVVRGDQTNRVFVLKYPLDFSSGDESYYKGDRAEKPAFNNLIEYRGLREDRVGDGTDPLNIVRYAPDLVDKITRYTAEGDNCSGTSPLLLDTDGDGFSDGWEWYFWTTIKYGVHSRNWRCWDPTYTYYSTASAQAGFPMLETDDPLDYAFDVDPTQSYDIDPNEGTYRTYYEVNDGVLKDNDIDPDTALPIVPGTVEITFEGSQFALYTLSRAFAAYIGVNPKDKDGNDRLFYMLYADTDDDGTPDSVIVNPETGAPEFRALDGAWVNDLTGEMSIPGWQKLVLLDKAVSFDVTQDTVIHVAFERQNGLFPKQFLLSRFDPMNWDEYTASDIPARIAAAGFMPKYWDPTSDLDGDGVSDVEEYFLGTDPLHWDTDRDGMPDGWEVMNGLLPLDPRSRLDGMGTGPLDNPDQDYMAWDATGTAKHADAYWADLNNEVYWNGKTFTGYVPGRAALPPGAGFTMEYQQGLRTVTLKVGIGFGGSGYGNLEEFLYSYYGITHGFWSEVYPSTGGRYFEWANTTTSPLNNDTDGDGIPDGWEPYVGYSPLIAHPPQLIGADLMEPIGYQFDPTGYLEQPPVCAGGPDNPDLDFDAECDLVQEFTCLWAHQMWPSNSTSEVLRPNGSPLGTNATVNGFAAYGGWYNKWLPTDPWNADTDGDGLSDAQEFSDAADGNGDGRPEANFNPTMADTDLDWLPDGWEYVMGTYSYEQLPNLDAEFIDDEYGPFGDPDGDKLANYQEYLTGANYGWRHDKWYPLDRESMWVPMARTDEETQKWDSMTPWDFPYDPGLYPQYGPTVRAHVYSPVDFFSVPVSGTTIGRGMEALKVLEKRWKYTIAESPSIEMETLAARFQRVYEIIYNYEAGRGIPVAPGNPERDPTASLFLYDTDPSYDSVYNSDMMPIPGKKYFHHHSREEHDAIVALFENVRSWIYSYAQCSYGWDPSAGLLNGGVYMPLNGNSTGYGFPGTRPKSVDSDNDGMPDYWEIYHGLNPTYGGARLLAKAGDPPNGDRADQDAMGDGSTDNWIMGNDPTYVLNLNFAMRAPYRWPIARKSKTGWWYDTEGTWNPYSFDDAVTTAFGPDMAGNYIMEWAHYDLVNRPWLSGDKSADADKDGLNNQEEAYSFFANDNWSHTDPSPYWLTDMSQTVGNFGQNASHVNLYYQAADYGAAKIWWWAVPFGGGKAESPQYVWDFETNEGFDTDNDNIGDREEMASVSSRGKTDPQDFDSPVSRKAMYFDGHAACRTQRPFFHDQYALTSHTVEFWVRPHEYPASGRISTLIHRPVLMPVDTLSGAKAWDIRNTFHVYMDELGRVYGQVDNDGIEQAANSAVVMSAGRLVLDKWAHIAVVMDSQNDDLALYINGEFVGRVACSLKPCTGIIMSSSYREWFTSNGGGSNGLSTVSTTSVNFDWSPAPIVVGAYEKNPWGVVGGKLWGKTETQFDENRFFDGWIDEIRIWDRCRSQTQIMNDMTRRYKSADVEKINRARWVWDKDHLYTTDAEADFPQKLLYHYSFDNLPDIRPPRAEDRVPPRDDATVFFTDTDPLPLGWDVNASIRPVPFVPWWYLADNRTTVYATDFSYVPFIENTASHLAQRPPRDVSEVVPVYNPVSSTGVEANNWKFLGYRYRRSSDWATENQAAIENGGWQYVDFLYYPTNFMGAQGPTDITYYYQAADSGILPGSLLINTMNPYGDGYNTHVRGSYEYNPWNFGGELDRYGVYEGLPIHSDLVPLLDAAADIDVPMWDGKGAGWDNAAIDSDGDGLPDWWEIAFGLDPNDDGTKPGDDGVVRPENGSYGDRDNDGLDNWAEYLAGTDPFAFDTDCDGYSDYYSRPDNHSLTYGELYDDGDGMDNVWESEHGLDPNRYDATDDADSDGWTNWEEYMAHVAFLEYQKDPTSFTHPLVDANPRDASSFPEPWFNATFYYSGERVNNAENVPGSPMIQTYGEKTAGPNMGGWFDGRYKSERTQNSFPDPISSRAFSVALHTEVFHSVYQLDDYPVGGEIEVTLLVNGQPTTVKVKKYADDPNYGLIVNVKSPFAFALLRYSTGQILLQGGATDVTSASYSVAGTTFPYTARGLHRTADTEDPVESLHDHMVSGWNRFLGWLDMDGNGKWSVGEPMGLSQPRPTIVGWDTVETTIPLSDSVWDYPRIEWEVPDTLTNGVSASDLTYFVTFKWKRGANSRPDASTTDDTDGDGLDDWMEALAGTDPNSTNGVPNDYYSIDPATGLFHGELYDDGDGLPSAWEMRYGVDPHRFDAQLDLDDDGWSNWAEFMAGTDPSNPDDYPAPSFNVTFRYTGKTDGVSSLKVLPYGAAVHGIYPGRRDGAARIANDVVQGGFSDGIYVPINTTIGLWSDAGTTTALDTDWGQSFIGQKNITEATLYAYIDNEEVSYTAVPFYDDKDYGMFVLDNVARIFIRWKDGVILTQFFDTDSGRVSPIPSDIQNPYSMPYRITFTTAGKEFPMTVANLSLDDSKISGHMVEGPNRFLGLMDLDGDGEWDPGEPMGLSLGGATPVGWETVAAEIPLTDSLWGYPRVAWPAAEFENPIYYVTFTWVRGAAQGTETESGVSYYGVTGDWDGDGLEDWMEALAGSSTNSVAGEPNDYYAIDPESGFSYGELLDDGDGMPTAWEMRYGLDPYRYDGNVDTDDDGWSNWAEFMAGTDPAAKDSYPKPKFAATFYYDGTESDLASVGVYTYGEKTQGGAWGGSFDGRYTSTKGFGYGRVLGSDGTVTLDQYSDAGASGTFNVTKLDHGLIESASINVYVEGTDGSTEVRTFGMTPINPGMGVFTQDDMGWILIELESGRVLVYGDYVGKTADIQTTVRSYSFPVTFSNLIRNPYGNHTHMVEGPNRFFGWMDLNGNETYDQGEPMGLGLHSPSLVGWDSASVEIPLTDARWDYPRLSWSMPTNAGWFGATTYYVNFSWVRGASTRTDTEAGTSYYSTTGDWDGDGLEDWMETLALEKYGVALDPASTNGAPNEYYSLSGGDVGLSWGELYDDGDGMPTAWEKRFGLSPYRYDAPDDADDDGWSNYAEFMAGTDPTSASDYPHPRLSATFYYHGKETDLTSLGIYTYGEKTQGTTWGGSYDGRYTSTKGFSDAVSLGSDGTITLDEYSDAGARGTFAVNKLRHGLIQSASIDVYVEGEQGMEVRTFQMSQINPGMGVFTQDELGWILISIESGQVLSTGGYVGKLADVHTTVKTYTFPVTFTDLIRNPEGSHTHMVEGPNRFFGWMDLDGNEIFDQGEPSGLGLYAPTLVGWDSTSVEVPLTDSLWDYPRVSWNTTMTTTVQEGSETNATVAVVSESAISFDPTHYIVTFKYAGKETAGDESETTNDNTKVVITGAYEPVWGDTDGDGLDSWQETMANTKLDNMFSCDPTNKVRLDFDWVGPDGLTYGERWDDGDLMPPQWEAANLVDPDRFDADDDLDDDGWTNYEEYLAKTWPGVARSFPMPVMEITYLYQGEKVNNPVLVAQTYSERKQGTYLDGNRSKTIYMGGLYDGKYATLTHYTSTAAADQQGNDNNDGAAEAYHDTAGKFLIADGILGEDGVQTVQNVEFSVSYISQAKVRESPKIQLEIFDPANPGTAIVKSLLTPAIQAGEAGAWALTEFNEEMGIFPFNATDTQFMIFTVTNEAPMPPNMIRKGLSFYFGQAASISTNSGDYVTLPYYVKVDDPNLLWGYDWTTRKTGWGYLESYSPSGATVTSSEYYGALAFFKYETGAILTWNDFSGYYYRVTADDFIDGFVFPVTVGAWYRDDGTPNPVASWYQADEGAHTHAAGGYNRILGFSDLNQNGTWDMGEPMGLSLYNSVLAGPDSFKATIPLTDELFGFPRISWPASTNENVTSYKVDFWTGMGQLAGRIFVEAPRTFLHEGDWIEAATKANDGKYGMNLGSSTTGLFEYQVSADNGSTWEDIASGTFVVSVKPNEGSRRTMRAISPVAESTVYGSLVEFKWEMDWRNQGVFIKIEDANGVVPGFDATADGLYIPFPVRHNKVTDDDYYYTYIPQLENGRSIIHLPSGTYTYTITENIRSTAVTKQSVTGQFTINNEENDSRLRASIKGHIHYYGRLPASDVPGKVVVEAYKVSNRARTSISVGGSPVAWATVDPADGSFELTGLEAGTYGVIGWVDDPDENGDRDGVPNDTETQGFGFLGQSASPVQVPWYCVPLVITNTAEYAACDLEDVHVILRDRDTDSDGVPNGAGFPTNETLVARMEAYKAMPVRTFPGPNEISDPTALGWISHSLFSTNKIEMTTIGGKTIDPHRTDPVRDIVTKEFVVKAPRTFLHEGDLAAGGLLGFDLGETNSIAVSWTVKATDGRNFADCGSGDFTVWTPYITNAIPAAAWTEWVKTHPESINYRRSLKARWPTQGTVVRGSVVDFEWEMDEHTAGVIFRIEGITDPTFVTNITVPFPVMHWDPSVKCYYYKARPQMEDGLRFLPLPDGTYRYTITERTRSNMVPRQSITETFQIRNDVNSIVAGSIEGDVRYYGRSMTGDAPNAKWVDGNGAPNLHVQAYKVSDTARSSASVGGQLVAETVQDANGAFRIGGLAAGTYSVFAFVDSNGNGIADEWETQGFGVFGGSASPVVIPATAPAIVVTNGAFVTQVNVVLHDRDTDGDLLPDVWEWREFSSLTAHNGYETSVSNDYATTKLSEGEGVLADWSWRATNVVTRQVDIPQTDGLRVRIDGPREFLHEGDLVTPYILRDRSSGAKDEESNRSYYVWKRVNEVDGTFSWKPLDEPYYGFYLGSYSNAVVNYTVEVWNGMDAADLAKGSFRVASVVGDGRLPMTPRWPTQMTPVHGSPVRFEWNMDDHNAGVLFSLRNLDTGEQILKDLVVPFPVRHWDPTVKCYYYTAEPQMEAPLRFVDLSAGAYEYTIVERPQTDLVEPAKIVERFQLVKGDPTLTTATLSGDVRYYGRAMEPGDPPTWGSTNLHIQAYEVSDAAMSSASVGGRLVADIAQNTNGAFRIDGLKAGTYTVFAFVDSNTNGVADSWETQGIGVLGGNASPVIVAASAPPIVVTNGAFVTQINVVLHDRDTDGDLLPDAWEWGYAGSLTDANGYDPVASNAYVSLPLSEGETVLTNWSWKATNIITRLIDIPETAGLRVRIDEPRTFLHEGDLLAPYELVNRTSSGADADGNRRHRLWTLETSGLDGMQAWVPLDRPYYGFELGSYTNIEVKWTAEATDGVDTMTLAESAFRVVAASDDEYDHAAARYPVQNQVVRTSVVQFEWLMDDRSAGVDFRLWKEDGPATEGTNLVASMTIPLPVRHWDADERCYYWTARPQQEDGLRFLDLPDGYYRYEIRTRPQTSTLIASPRVISERFQMAKGEPSRVTGSIDGTIRYFGRSMEAGTPPTWPANLHLQARLVGDSAATSASVGGEIVSDEVRSTNGAFRVTGLAAGTYTILAFVDSNGNGIADDWETQGYGVFGGSASPVVVPGSAPPIVVTNGAAVTGVNVVLHDRDTDGDKLPDVWEWSRFGNLAKSGYDINDEVIPNGLRLLDYVESTGAQWVDTGVFAGPQTRSETDIAVMEWGDGVLLSGSGSNRHAFGKGWSGSITNGGNAAKLYFGLGAQNYASAVKLATLTGSRHVYWIDAATATAGLDEREFSLASAGDIGTNLFPAALLAQRGGAAETNIRGNMTARLYGCKYYEAGTLVRDFVPVLDANGVAGLLDRVSGQVFYSATATPFVAGPERVPADGEGMWLWEAYAALPYSDPDALADWIWPINWSQVFRRAAATAVKEALRVRVESPRTFLHEGDLLAPYILRDRSPDAKDEPANRLYRLWLGQEVDGVRNWIPQTEPYLGFNLGSHSNIVVTWTVEASDGSSSAEIATGSFPVRAEIGEARMPATSRYPVQNEKVRTSVVEFQWTMDECNAGVVFDVWKVSGPEGTKDDADAVQILTNRVVALPVRHWDAAKRCYYWTARPQQADGTEFVPLEEGFYVYRIATRPQTDLVEPETIEERFQMRKGESSKTTASIAGTIRYFGRSMDTNSVPPTWPADLHLQAWKVSSKASSSASAGGIVYSDEVRATNGAFRVSGLEAGTYAIVAFVDSNGNGVADDWETQGFGTYGGSASPVVIGTTAYPISVTNGAAVTNINVVLHDRDTDNDLLPDVWEWAYTNSLSGVNGYMAAVSNDYVSRIWSDPDSRTDWKWPTPANVGTAIVQEEIESVRVRVDGPRTFLHEGDFMMPYVYGTRLSGLRALGYYAANGMPTWDDLVADEANSASFVSSKGNRIPYLWRMGKDDSQWKELSVPYYGFWLGSSSNVLVKWSVEAWDGADTTNVADGSFHVISTTGAQRKRLAARYPTQQTEIFGNVVEFEWEMDDHNAGVYFTLRKLSGEGVVDDQPITVISNMVIAIPVRHGRFGVDGAYYSAVPQLDGGALYAGKIEGEPDFDRQKWTWTPDNGKTFVDLPGDGLYEYWITERPQSDSVVPQTIVERFRLVNGAESRRALYDVDGTIRYYGKVMQRKTVEIVSGDMAPKENRTSYELFVLTNQIAQGSMGVLLVRGAGQFPFANENGIVQYTNNVGRVFPVRETTNNWNAVVSDADDWAEEVFNDSTANGILYASSAETAWSGTIDYETGRIQLNFSSPPDTNLSFRVVKKVFPVPLVLQAFKLADDANTCVSVSGTPVFQTQMDTKGIFEIKNLVAGRYAIRAFLDSNGNGYCDEWETQGLAVQTGTVSPNLDPNAAPIVVADNVTGLMIVLHDRDTDNDLLPDAWEWWKAGGSLLTSGYESDEGGLEWWRQYADGVLDSDPRTPDTDLDGLTDAMEILVTQTDTHLRDTDGDGIGDLEEFLSGSDPLKASEAIPYTVPSIAFDGDGVPFVEVSYPALRPGVTLTYELQRKESLSDEAWTTVGELPVANDGGAVFYSQYDGVNAHLSDPGTGVLRPEDQLGPDAIDLSTGFYRIKVFADYGKMVENADGTCSFWTWVRTGPNAFEYREAARGKGKLVRDANGNWSFVSDATGRKGVLVRGEDGTWSFQE